MPHIIKSNSSSKLPTLVVSVDCESTQARSTANDAIMVHSLRLWTAQVAVYKGGVQQSVRSHLGRTHTEFWSLIGELALNHKELLLVAHNASFDMALLQLPRLIDNGEIGVSFACLETPPYIISAKLGRTRLSICDTLNWYNMPLAALGVMLNLPKLPMPAANAPEEDWIDYCYRDSEIVHRIMRDLIGIVREEDFGTFRLTAASQGWNAYRHRWMDRDIRVHCHAGTLQLERQSYYGGCERLFRYGEVKGMLYQIDMNWAYGTAMANDDQPYRAIDYFSQCSIELLAEVIKTHIAAARVTLNTKTRAYPVRRAGRVDYAIGHFGTTLCGAELVAALNERHVVHVGAAAAYERADILGTFVSHMNNLSISAHAMGQHHIARLAKGMVNGLYGKFAQTCPEWKDDPDRFPLHCGEQWHSYDDVTGKLYTHRQLARKIQTLCGRYEGDDSCPIISACIAAGVRCRMQHAIDVIGDDNCILQYCDSLIVTKKGYQIAQQRGVIDGDMPGRFKLVSTSKGGMFYSPTDYTWDGVPRICGIPRRAEQTAPDTYQYDHWETAGEIFSRQPDGTVLVIPQTRVMQRVPPVQGVDGNGRVKPIVINE